MIGLAKEKDGLYFFEEHGECGRVKSLSSSSFQTKSVLANKEEIWLQHRRLGHPSFNVLKVVFPSLFKNVSIESLHGDICEFAKHKRSSYPRSNTRTFVPFELIHSDIWGPSNISNISGFRWFVSFIDDCTRVTWIYLLKQKSDVSSIFPRFHNMIQTQFGVQIKRFRSDNAKDFFNQSLSTFFEKQGILHESSCVNTPQQKGVAERKNSHLLAVTRALLFQTNVPKHFWGEAVLTATHLIN